MKVLIINHFPLEGSGSGIYTKNIAKKLHDEGHEVLLIVPDHYEVKADYKVKTILFKNEENEKYDLDFNFPCFTTHPRSNKTFYNLTDEEMKKYIDAMQGAVDEAVSEFKPDIAHCQHLWIGPYCAYRAGIPYVVTAHGTDLKGFVIDERYVPYALEGGKHAGKVITISKQVDKEVGELYKIPKEKRTLILNGFDEDIFNLKNVSREEVLKEFGIKSPKYLVSFVGKLADFKGVDLLIRAAKIYEDELGDVATLIVGHGELKDQLMALKEELNIKNLHFLGHQNQEKVADIYNVADVSTVPSRKEPFGLVAIEALACGTPVVVTSGGGLVDFVDDSIGTVIDEEDFIGLANGIISEIKREDKKEKRERAHRFAMENFSWKRVIKEVTQVYQDVIEGKEL
ncbi:glycosyltransferase involved in cell wall biosynthesis [Acetoanaerobium pronyense]|uniref:Glycosyltransferase involved in cell wall biosynthesis n=1 Tax=Acetoanaerobium pronyense TaxID=1482736 RepID=A0ABS4KHT3_9FIRM|nr:glycosyltransferase family 4 protein [Acetoanaerobium pronyense]MBP2027343.1 glycosyltransferase involved in cell wall biosynthesis [Acetoanaerobium pronyense]